VSTTPQPRPTPHLRTWRTVQTHLDAPDALYTQGSLALSYVMPSGVSAEPRTSALTLVRRSSDGPAGEAATLSLGRAVMPAGTGPGPSGPLPPDAVAWAARFVQAVVEVVSSDRPLSQLVRWTDEPVYAEIARRRRSVVLRRGNDPHIRISRQQVATVHVAQPTAGAAEVAARVICRGRSRALAARLEYVRERWTCTAISFG